MGTLVIIFRGSSSAWQYDFSEEFARVPPGETRVKELMPLSDGRYDVTTTVTHGTVVETIRASFEIPAPRVVVEGPSCGS